MIHRILDDTCSFYGYYWKEAGFWMTRGSTQLTRETCGVTRHQGRRPEQKKPAEQIQTRVSFFLCGRFEFKFIILS